MPTFSQLPSGRWRVQVRRGGAYKAATFDKKRDAEDWAREVESQAKLVAVKGFAPPPAESTLADLIGKYQDLHARDPRKTKLATLLRLKADPLGKVRLRASAPCTFATSLIVARPRAPAESRLPGTCRRSLLC